LKIAIATDAWRPQTNGVVTTLTRTAECLESLGHEVTLMTPQGLPTVACPSYPEIRLALFQGRRVREWLEQERPDALHIATEGPLGFAARAAARRLRLGFTTSYHTQFPQYLRARYPIPEALSYAGLRFFHGAAARTMVATHHVRQQLQHHGLRNLALWTRGVDTELFRPRHGVVIPELAGRPGPVLMYVGRVAVEKSIEDFLAARTAGTKVVVGDGPALNDVRSRYPDVVFLGFRFGEELARIISAADVFVFPSRTDTFGIVMLEAMACGVPVAAYPTTGPIDVVRDGEVGCLDENLVRAIDGALRLDRRRCRDYALGFRWERATLQFLGNLVSAAPARAPHPVKTAALAAQPRREPARFEHR
jgi:glycosyltransferase involved in cell wall biosynthesis